MKVEQINPGSCWTYLITADDNSCVLIDPVIIHVDLYLDLIKKRELTLKQIIDTHTHADHISAAPSLMQSTGCSYLMHEKAPAKCVTQRVKQDDIIEVAGKKAKVIETPGHTRDSISLLFDDMIFTGDFLFLDDAGAGRDDLPGGDASSHWESLQKLKSVSGDVMVYPAHEYRNRIPSILGSQRKTNPHLKNRTKTEFTQYIDDLKLGPAEWMKDVLKANYNCSTDPNAAYIPSDVPACEIKGTIDPGLEDIELLFISKDDFLKLDSPIVVDVREPEELNDALGHLDNSLNIPVEHLKKRIEELSEYKNKKIITVCRSGARASTAALLLTAEGFTDVMVLDGGLIAYRFQ